MKNKKTNFNPIKLIGALVFLMAFTLNIQTSLNGEWELVNVGFANGSSGSGGENCTYRTLGQKSDGSYCCVKSCNSLDKCSQGVNC